MVASLSLYFFLRIVFKLQKRQSQDDKLGSSKAVTEANKQLTKTCVGGDNSFHRMHW